MFDISKLSFSIIFGFPCFITQPARLFWVSALSVLFNILKKFTKNSDSKKMEHRPALEPADVPKVPINIGRPSSLLMFTNKTESVIGMMTCPIRE